MVPRFDMFANLVGFLVWSFRILVYFFGKGAATRQNISSRQQHTHKEEREKGETYQNNQTPSLFPLLVIVYEYARHGGWSRGTRHRQKEVVVPTASRGVSPECDWSSYELKSNPPSPPTHDWNVFAPRLNKRTRGPFIVNETKPSSKLAPVCSEGLRKHFHTLPHAGGAVAVICLPSMRPL